MRFSACGFRLWAGTAGTAFAAGAAIAPAPADDGSARYFVGLPSNFSRQARLQKQYFFPALSVTNVTVAKLTLMPQTGSRASSAPVLAFTAGVPSVIKPVAVGLPR